MEGTELSASDYQLLLESVRELHAHCELSEFPRRLLAILRKLVPCDTAAYEEFNPLLSRVVGTMDPLEARPNEKYIKVFAHHISRGGHPVLSQWAHEPQPRPRAISELVSRAEFHGSGIYNDLYKHFEVEDQLGLNLAMTRPLVVAVGMNRSGVFSARDRQMFEFLQPHARQAYTNAVALEMVHSKNRAAFKSLEDADCGVIKLSPSLQIASCNPAGRRQLSAYFPAPKRPAELPDKLRRWVFRHLEALADLKSAELFKTEGPGGTLQGRIARISAEGDALLILRESSPPKPQSVDHLIQGMSTQTREVLRHLLAGLSEKETASQMQLSRNTVHNYITAIYRRFDVTTRAELLARCLRAPSSNE